MRVTVVRALTAMTGLVLIAGCGDFSPGGIRRVGLSIVPQYDTRGVESGGASDVDSFVIVIDNPPAKPETLSVKIQPGQDSIVLTINVDVNAGADTIGVAFDGYSSSTGLKLYSGTVNVNLIGGLPQAQVPVPVSYVGPGQSIGSLTLAPRSAALAPAGTSQLTVVARDTLGATMPPDSAPARYISRDTHVASVSSAGLVTAVANGSTYVLVQSVAKSSIKDSAQITVATVAPPVIGLAPTSVTFTAPAGGANPADQTVDVSNSGGGSLTGLAAGTISYGAGASGWLTATLNATTAPATLTLHAVTGSLAQGSYTATVPVTSGAASNSPQNVSVTFTVAQPPAVIALSSATVSVNDTVGTLSPNNVVLNVTNGGGGTLSGLAVGTITYGAGASGWLTASLGSGTAPTTLTLQFSNAGLAAGTYAATVPVTSGAANNSPQNVAVTIVMAPSPLASIAITQGVMIARPGDVLALSITAKNALGQSRATPSPITFTSRSPAVATVSSGGTITAVAGGTAVVVADTGGIRDSMLVAVGADGSAVVSAIGDGRGFDSRVLVGDTVRVRVAVDLRGVSPEKLGSYNAQLVWNSTQLNFVAVSEVAGGANWSGATINCPASQIVTNCSTGSNQPAGTIRFGGADPNGKAGPTVALLDLKFVATASGASTFTLTLTDLTAASTFTPLLSPALIVSGKVRVQ